MTTKKNKLSTAPAFKYGINMLFTVEQANGFDKANRNTYWKYTTEKEVKALLDLVCLEFKPAEYDSTLDESWQKMTLHMVFDVNKSLARKCCLVDSGHLIDMMETKVYSSTVKSISVQLLHVISHKAVLEQFCGDIGNDFPNDDTKDKMYICKAGTEF